jgi:threonylcarbamoyladenosine tRNA methylthiotransferase MtaB
MDKKKIAVHTFGCKLNYAETSAILRSLSPERYDVIDFREKADIYVIHSCAVTTAAEKKCRQSIRQARKKNPAAAVVVLGCYGQLRPQELRVQGKVDLVLGNREKFRLGRYLDRLDAGVALSDNTPPFTGEEFFIPSWSLADRTRSFLKIQDGCDYFCSYCTVPLARGRSRSATIKETLTAARDIAVAGVKEIVLTGVNIGDFGRHQGTTLLHLMKEMDGIDGIARIRISSIEPDLLSDVMVHFIASSRKFMPHFHLPLQSASDPVLAAMHRRYRRGDFAGRISLIRKVMPDSCIAADVIVGFPGETEKHFMETFLFLSDQDISYAHVFSYSQRPGTAAAKLPDQVAPGIIKERSERLHDLSAQKKRAFYKKNHRRLTHVLFESDPCKDHLFGFTENYIRVRAPFDVQLINKIVPVVLNDMDSEGNYYYRGLSQGKVE